MTEPDGPLVLTEEEKIALLRAALHSLRPKLAGLRDRVHVDQVLRLTV